MSGPKVADSELLRLHPASLLGNSLFDPALRRFVFDEPPGLVLGRLRHAIEAIQAIKGQCDGALRLDGAASSSRQLDDRPPHAHPLESAGDHGKGLSEGAVVEARPRTEYHNKH